jgi:hypothetical protein
MRGYGDFPVKKLMIALTGLAFLAGAAGAQTTTPMTKDSMKEDKKAPMGKDRKDMPKDATKNMQKGSDMPGTQKK